jgi:glycerate dehydrogenase
MHRIVYLERNRSSPKSAGRLSRITGASIRSTLQTEVGERLAGATIAIVNKLQLDAELIAALPALRMIAVAATGTNNVDLDACRARRHRRLNIRGYAEHTVPEHVFALLLALSRNLIAYRQAVAAGSGSRPSSSASSIIPIRDLHGATLAIIGSGSLGCGVARLAEAFGMHVLRSERKDAATLRPGYTPFAAGLREADAISLHCPLTSETTRHLIGETNCGDEALGAADQHRARRSGRRGGAARRTARGLDRRRRLRCPERRATGAGNPLLAPELLALPNFLLTPHVAWASQPAMQALADQLTANLEAFARGEPQNRVA